MLSGAKHLAIIFCKVPARGPCFSLDFSPYGRRPKGSAVDLKVHVAQDDITLVNIWGKGTYIP